MTRLRIVLMFVLGAVAAVGALAACSGDDAGQSQDPIFGTQDSSCASRSLVNEDSDEAELAAFVDCLFGEYEATRPVVTDLRAATVEGDFIYYRFDYDGDRVLIVEDSRADEFGVGSVRARSCRDLVRTSWVPDGHDCEGADHNGFPEATLDG